MDSASIVILSGLVIGLVYGSVGLLSGFCLMSGMRGWLAEGDGRLIRSYALAIGVAVAVTQLLAARGLVDIGKSIYLQPSFSAPLMFFGGLLFGYGMVLSNGCGSRALVLLGRGNLRSFVVVVMLAIFAQMTLKGLIAPARIAMVGASQTTATANSVPALLAAAGLSATVARMLAASVISAALIIFAFAHPAFRRSPGQVAARANTARVGLSGAEPAESAARRAGLPQAVQAPACQAGVAANRARKLLAGADLAEHPGGWSCLSVSVRTPTRDGAVRHDVAAMREADAEPLGVGRRRRGLTLRALSPAQEDAIGTSRAGVILTCRDLRK